MSDDYNPLDPTDPRNQPGGDDLPARYLRERDEARAEIERLSAVIDKVRAIEPQLRPWWTDGPVPERVLSFGDVRAALDAALADGLAAPVGETPDEPEARR